MDRSPPGSSVYGILQARILECVAIPFSRGSFRPGNQTWVSCIADGFFTMWATRSKHPWHSTQALPLPSPTFPTRAVHVLLMRNVHYTSILSRIYSLFLGFTLHVVHFMDLQKCTVTYIHPYSITWNSFNILKILCSTYLAIPSPLTPGNHWSFCSLHSFVSSRMSCSCNHIVCGPSDWLFLLSRMHLGFLHIFLFWTSLVVQKVKHLPIMQETWVQSPGRKDLLEKEMATHSSILAWKIP